MRTTTGNSSLESNMTNYLEMNLNSFDFSFQMQENLGNVKLTSCLLKARPNKTLEGDKNETIKTTIVTGDTLKMFLRKFVSRIYYFYLFILCRYCNYMIILFITVE